MLDGNFISIMKKEDNFILKYASQNINRLAARPTSY